MMKKIYICVLFLISVSIQSFAIENKEDSLKLAVKELSNAFATSNTDGVKEYLSTKFSVSIGSYPSSLNYYLNKLVKDKIVQSIDYLSINNQSKEAPALVDVRYNLADGKTIDSSIAFDSENKILYSDYLDRFFSPSRYGASKLVAQIPFAYTEDGKSILLSLKLNDKAQPLNFLFDTGANGIAISKESADRVGVVATGQNEAHVVGGTISMPISDGNTIYLSDSIALKNQKMSIITKFSDKYDGIVGLNIARNYIVDVNFDKMLMSLYTIGDYKFEESGHMVEIAIPSGLLTIPISINIVGKKEVKGNFLLDSGANYMAIAFEQFVRKNRLLLSGFKPEGEASTVSMGVVTPVYYGKTSQFKIADHIIVNDMPITLQASSGRKYKSEGVPDGSIGIQLISNYNFTIDMLRKIIHLRPVKN